MIRFLLLFFPLAHCFAMTRLPDEFTVTERFFSVVSTFDVACNEQSMATATKRFFALTPIYDLEDPDSGLLATARSRFFTWGTIADIEDSEGKPIGRIEENLWRILPWAEYKVFDAENREIMVAIMDFWGTEFTLSDPLYPDRVFATISRPFIRVFRDDWTINIRDHQIFETEAVDPRLLVLLAVYQTDKDNRARFYYEYKDQLYKEVEQYEGIHLD